MYNRFINDPDFAEAFSKITEVAMRHSANNARVVSMTHPEDELVMKMDEIINIEIDEAMLGSDWATPKDKLREVASLYEGELKRVFLFSTLIMGRKHPHLWRRMATGALVRGTLH